MTAAATDLQKAVFPALGAEAGLTTAVGDRIFDHAPANVGFPYITFGRTSIYDWSTSTESGTEHLFTLHVWSKAKGKKETLEIMDMASSALQQPGLALENHHLVSLRLEFSEARYDDDLSVHHGLLRFRAVVEAVG